MSTNVELILAGNKSDMFEFSEVNETEARNYAKEHNAVYKLVSAKSGTGIGVFNYYYFRIFMKLLVE